MLNKNLHLIKLDMVRGNSVVSRRQVVSSNKKEDKAKIIEKFKVGDIIKDAVVKGYSSFGCFFEVTTSEGNNRYTMSSSRNKL